MNNCLMYVTRSLAVLLMFFFCGYVHLVEFGVHLAELTVDPQGALAIRQVSMKQPKSTFAGEQRMSDPQACMSNESLMCLF